MAALALLLLTAAFGAAAGEIAEKNGDIVILFTSDVHCGIDQNFGFAGLQRFREYLESEGNSVILVDNGDQIQGEPIGTLTKGGAIIDLMNAVGYDIAIPGNHEFDYGMDCFLDLVKRSKHQYISCNLTYKGELMFEPYTVRELAGKKVAFIGVTTRRHSPTATRQPSREKTEKLFTVSLQMRRATKYTAPFSRRRMPRARKARRSS